MLNKETTPIIKSLLWTDLYKLTMGQVVFNNFPDLGAGYEFINRGKTQFPNGFADKLRRQLDLISRLKLSNQEADGLIKKTDFLKPEFLDFFLKYQFDPSEVLVKQSGGDLSVHVDGPWKRSIFWEVPLMATISELFYQETNQTPKEDWREKARAKGQRLRENNVKTLEFGTRRSFSTEVHEGVLEELLKSAGRVSEGGVILGSSNISLALKHDIPVLGTYAHELPQGMAAIFGPNEANRKTLDIWSKEYPGKFGIALPDTFTTDVFLRSFDLEKANLYDGVRQDSGNPSDFAEKIIAHYLSLGVDPQSKKIVFSDGLNTEKAIALNERFRGRIQTSFGIGTHFTNDVGVTPLNIVVKLFSLRFPDGSVKPVVKLSDDLGKSSGDKKAVEQIRSELQIVVKEYGNE